MLRIEKNIIPSRSAVFRVSILLVFMACVVIGIIFVAYGINPLKAYTKIFMETLSSSYGISEIVWKSIPLLLCGVGLLLAFQASSI